LAELGIELWIGDAAQIKTKRLGQNETLEFIYGRPHTLLRRLQRRFFNRSSDDDPS
jgi:hypothetical protein